MVLPKPLVVFWEMGSSVKWLGAGRKAFGGSRLGGLGEWVEERGGGERAQVRSGAVSW